MPTSPPPQDPHEGSEDDPRRELERTEDAPVAPPRRYEPDAPPVETAPARREPTVMDRLVAASGPLSVLVFFLIGFGADAWYVAWLVFLVPAILHSWNRPGRK